MGLIGHERAGMRAWWCLGSCVVGVWGSLWLMGRFGDDWMFGEGALYFGGAGLLVGVSVGLGWFGERVDWVRSGLLVVAVGMLMGGWTAVRVGGGGDGGLMSGLVQGDGDEGAIVRVRGVVVEGMEVREGRREVWEPVMWEGVRGRYSVRVDGVFTDDGEWVDMDGVVRVVVDVEDDVFVPVRVGDVVEVLGVYRGNSGRRNVGDPDWGAMARMEGRVGTVSVVGGGRVEVVGRRGGWWGVLRAREWVRGRGMSALGLGGGLDEELGGVDGGKVVLGALVLGERSSAGREVEQGFARVGVGHVLAVSGFHVAVLVGMCVLGLRVSGVGSGRRWVEGSVVCLVLVGMWVLVPVRVPMVRAMVLIGVLMMARGFGRRYDAMAVLGWVGVGLLVWRPMDAVGMGFQLSVGVTGLLVMMGQRVQARREEGVLDLGRDDAKGWWERGLIGWVWGALKVNGACWLLALPGVMWHVGTVSVVGILMAVVVALMAGVLMAAGYVQVVVGAVSPGLAGETLFVVEWMAGCVAGFVGWVDGVGWSSVRGVKLSIWWTVGATALVWGALVRVRWMTGGKRWWRAVVLAGVLGVWGIGEQQWRGGVDSVRVEMVDVRDGSAYMVRSGDEAMVYDCGSLDFRVGATMERVARERGVRRISVAVVSHDNLDHYNGLVELARLGVGFERVYVGAGMLDGGSDAWRAVRKELIAQGAEVLVLEVGDLFVMGDAVVRCVGGGSGQGENDDSLVLRIDGASKGRRSMAHGVLLTGDVGAEGIGLIDDRDLAGVVVMELPHHGSVSGGARGAVEGLIELVDPGVVLQSTGSSRVDGRWDGFRSGRDWYTSAVGGGAWVEVGVDGSVRSGWSVEGGE